MKKGAPGAVTQESSEKAVFESLNLAYDEARSLIQTQLGQIDGLDTKASTLLAASGLVLSVMLSSQALSIFLLGNKGLSFGMVDYVFLSAACVFLAISLILGAMALHVRHYKWAPHPRTMRTKYLNWPEHKAKLQILDNLVVAYEENSSTLSKKATWLAYGFTFFAVGTATLVTIFVVSLARYLNMAQVAQLIQTK